jgi:large subunit ribosomal protein L15
MNLIKLGKDTKRVGRGISAGGGKTAGRGTKGQNARTGKKRYQGFQSGALPLAQRLPKIAGTKSGMVRYSLTTDQVNRYFKSGEAVSVAALQRRGLIGRVTERTTVKIVSGKEALQAKVTDEQVRCSRTVAEPASK